MYRAERYNPETREYEFLGDAETEMGASFFTHRDRITRPPEDNSEYRIRPVED